jgi:hypothetical protein
VVRSGGVDALQLYWTDAAGPAATHCNQGVAMMLPADRTNDAAKAKAAVQQIQAALDMMRATRVASGAAFYQVQLVQARELVGELSQSR